MVAACLTGLASIVFVSAASAAPPALYGSTVLGDNPVAYYKLDDSIGSSVMDDAGASGTDGAYRNDVALRQSPAISCQRRPHPANVCLPTAPAPHLDLNQAPSEAQGYAASFSGDGGYGEVNGINAPTTGYTLEAWVNPRTTGAMSIAGQGGGGQLFLDSLGRLALRQTQDTVTSATVVAANAWTHVAATWDDGDPINLTDGVTRLYVNGVEVASSTTANAAPSGAAAFYVGYGDQAPWFDGALDEVAYYGSALAASDIDEHYDIGAAADGAGSFPTIDIRTPAQNGLYTSKLTSIPAVDFSCSDFDDGTLAPASCTAVIDGVTPRLDGDPLVVTNGVHSIEVTATDSNGNVSKHTHTYTVTTFAAVMQADTPVAYYRLGDAINATVMDAATGPDGEYKNNQNSGPTGISGDGDKARDFIGDGGYGFVNGIAAPRYGSTLGAWAKPDDPARNQSIVGHGDGGELYISAGKFTYRHMSTTVTQAVNVDCPAPTAAAFRHVVGVWNGTTATIYVDGKACGSAKATRRPSSASTFYVGYGELAQWFDGAIDEVVYYDQALSSDRVLQHFYADPPPDETPAFVPAAPAGDSPAGGGGDSGGGGGGGGGGASGGNDTAPAVAAPVETQDTGYGDSGDEPSSEPDEGAADEEDEEPAPDLSGAWTRADGSVVELTRKGKGWVGKTILPATRKASKSKSKASGAGKKRCGLKKGVNTIAIRPAKDGSYKGEILDPVTTGKKNKKKCVARKASFTAELDGDTLTLTKKHGKKASTEALTRM